MMTRNPTRTNTKTQGTDRRTTRTPVKGTRTGPRRAAVLVLGLLLFTVALAPAASADMSSKTVCLGDSENTGERRNMTGAGCAEGWIETRTKQCKDNSDDTRDCIIEGWLGVEVTGAQSCGNSASSWFTNTASACVNVDQTVKGDDTDRTEWEDIATIKNVPPKGMPVEIPAETCGWVDRAELATLECESYTHVHEIDASSTASAFEVLDGVVDYASTEAQNAESPISVTP